MILTLLAGLLVLGLAAALVARALMFTRVEASHRLRSIEMYGFARPDAAAVGLQRPRLDVSNLAERIGGYAIARMKGVDEAQMRRDLSGAGFYTVSPEQYLGYRLIVTAGLGSFLLLLAISAPSLIMIFGLSIAAILGWRLPPIVLQRRARARGDEIDRELPELIDLLVVSIEAGVGLAGALQMLAERMHGPLGVELRLMQQEQSMGLSGDQALSKLLERCDTPSIRSFVRSLQQGERLGVSIGQILRNLAIEMRTRRRQKAEERAQKAPVKILFPLIFLIFPSMFIVLLGPALITLRDTFL